MKKTIQQVITEAEAKHNGKYDYSLVQYRILTDVVTIICPIHGKFEQKVRYHLRGCGCPECAYNITRKITNITRYGVEHPTQNKEIKDKQQATWIKHYGGHPKQTKEVQDKYEETCLKNHGVKSPMHSKILREKQKQSCFNNHGVEYPMQSEKIRAKSKKTISEKYDVVNVSQLEEVKEKKRQTSIVKCGIDHSKRKHKIKEFQLLSDLNWVTDQYVNQNKTTIQISEELGVTDTTVGRHLKKLNIPIIPRIGYSAICIEWLEQIMRLKGVFIQHRLNGIGEFKIPKTKFSADGYCAETNTIYEFHGDIFHGNPDTIDPESHCNYYKPDLTARELYQATTERENKIKKLGYNLVVMWEGDFKNR